MKKFAFLFILIAVLLVAFLAILSNPKPNVVDECIRICKENLAAGKDLANGPCLANPIPSNPDWVCDVAHWPREEVDNLKENQCSAYGKVAKHFVEVTPNCTFIRAV